MRSSVAHQNTKSWFSTALAGKDAKLGLRFQLAADLICRQMHLCRGGSDLISKRADIRPDSGSVTLYTSVETSKSSKEGPQDSPRAVVV